MFRFLRRIRQKLARDDNWKNYLLYATGEIILIIAGILIALSVAEWNDSRKDRVKEKKHLQEIRIGLEANLEELETKLDETNKAFEKLSVLDSLLKIKALPYTRSLDTLFGAAWGLNIFLIERSPYEDLKAEGLGLIRDESIRKQLILIYEKRDESLRTISDIEYVVNNDIRVYYLNNFHDLVIRTSATPNDYEKLWSDHYYKNLIGYRLNTLRLNQMDFYALGIEEIKNLIDSINQYLDP